MIKRDTKQKKEADGSRQSGPSPAAVTPSTMPTPTPSVTLEQARALIALRRLGTIQAAASQLRKTHSAIIYLLKGFEDTLQIPILDRSGYRSEFTAKGLRILEKCEALMAAERNLLDAAQSLRDGWEADLKIVVDGIIPNSWYMNALTELQRESQHRTPVKITIAHLEDVKTEFEKSQADFMFGVLPYKFGPELSAETLSTRPLPAIHATLVCSAEHPLAKMIKITQAELLLHTLVTIRGSDQRFGLPTRDLDSKSSLHVTDFQTKKDAIVRGVGYGWLPDCMITQSLKKKRLVTLNCAFANTHVFHPTLYYRNSIGRAGKLFLSSLNEIDREH